VVVVTHLAQVAAQAARQVVVTKRGATTAVQAVDGDARRREIARMLGGQGESAAALAHADELMLGAKVEQ
jgi:DNA repair protein RecN (Recombination protein N)